MKQMTIFDYLDDRLQVGDSVKVTEPRDTDVESHFYFELYRGKKGVLVDIRKGEEVCYEVKFEGLRNGIFYESEITKI